MISGLPSGIFLKSTFLILLLFQTLNLQTILMTSVQQHHICRQNTFSLLSDFIFKHDLNPNLYNKLVVSVIHVLDFHLRHFQYIRDKPYIQYFLFFLLLLLRFNLHVVRGLQLVLRSGKSYPG